MTINPTTQPEGERMAQWQPIETVEPMLTVLLFHEYYSHGRVRQGFLHDRNGWRGVNANGTDGPLGFRPTQWMPLPEPPKTSRGGKA